MPRSHRFIAMAALLVPALSACSSGPAPPAVLAGLQAPCPRIAILADGADLTRFRDGGQRDLTAMVVDAKIAGFDAICDFVGRDRTALGIRVTPRFEAERGPAAEGRIIDLPWFAVLSDAGDQTLLDRQSFTTRMNFPANVPRGVVSGPTARLSLPLGESVRPAEFAVRISFQLTPEQLAQNRARGPR